MHWVPSIRYSLKWRIRWSWEVPFESLYFVFQHCVKKSRQHTSTLRSTMRPRIYQNRSYPRVMHTVRRPPESCWCFLCKWKQVLVTLKQRRFIRSNVLIDAYRHTRIRSTAILMSLPKFPWKRVRTKYSWKNPWRKLQSGSTQQILDPTGEICKK